MKLRDYRELLGLSRSQVAEELGTTGVTVWRWENGKARPNFTQSKRIIAWSKGAVTWEALAGEGEK